MKMIPKNTSKIILFLLKNVEKLGYNINQISKLNSISVGSAFKILKELEKNKIVSKKEINNASNYKLNFKNNETIKLCELLLLGEKRNLKGYAKIYADEIINFEQADLISLFGSVLKGREFNDVDVLFVTNQTKKVTDFCLDISKIRTKPIVPLILKKEDLIKEAKEEKESIIDIIKKGIIIKGESTFMEVIKNVNS
jgi:predicted nucleotidyltransferase